MSSRTEPLYHPQTSSSGSVLPEIPNPRDNHSINGDIVSLQSSNLEGAPGLLFLGDQQLSGAPAPSPPTPLPGSPPPSQTYYPPPALEEPNIMGGLRLPPLSSRPVISAPTPNTAKGSLDNLDTFIRTLNQELDHSPRASIICSVKRNDESENAHDGPLEQRLEKKMTVQLSNISPAANQRIKLPVPPATFDSGVSEPKPLSLSLVIAGETTRRIFGGVGLYHPNQPKSGLVNIIEGSNFTPVVVITPGRTVSVGFKFTTYPRQCDPSEEAFRVMVTIHDCDGKLVAYSLSTSAYSIKSHPRNIKRPLQASTEDSEDTGNPRSKRRRANSALASTSSSSTAGNRALPSNSSVTGSSNQQQSGGSSNTGGPPIVEPVVDRSGGTPVPIVDPRLQSLLQGACNLLSLSPIEGYQPMPTLDEAIPASCSWRGGIVISLFVNNLPQDGPIYARFGHIVVKTDRKTPHVLGCKVPAAPGPCEVDVTLSKGSGPLDAPYGRSLCKFTYEEDDITQMLRALKAEAQGPLWHAVQEYASRNRLLPPQSYAYQPTYDQSILGPWPLASYARLEVVEEEIETENDVIRPETSNNVPDLEVTSRGPSVIEDKCSDPTRTERGESAEGARGQDTKSLDMVPLDDTEDYTALRTISKPSCSPTLKPTEPAVHDYILNSPPQVTQHNQPAPPDPVDQALFGNARTSQQPSDIAPSAHPPSPNQQTHTSPTNVWNSSVTAQILPRNAKASYQSPPTNAITLTPGFSVEDSAHGTALFPMPNAPRETRQSIDLSHFYNDAVHPSYRSIRLKCHLKDPKGYQQNSKIITRREKSVVLEMQLRADCERMGWQGISLPRTGSVKQSNQQPPTRLLYFSIQVHGSTTGMSLTQPCDNCWRREARFPGNPHGRPHYLIDFKSDSPFILFSKVDNLPYAKAEVRFHFTCYSNHQNEDYELVARLHDEQGNLIAYHQIPYSFRSVPKADRDGILQDDYPSVPSVASPAATIATFESGSSSASYYTASSRSSTSSFSQLTAPPGGQDRTSIRYPAPPILLPREAVECRPTSFGIGPRKDIQRPEGVDQPILQRAVPSEGPTQGGPKIVLIGTNFPPWPAVIYARFGSAIARTSWINPYTLECTLPPSTTGIVDVTLSLVPVDHAPVFGRSLCTFTYREGQESFLLMLRSIYSQGHEPSRMPLDILIPQILQHTNPETPSHALRRIGRGRESLQPIDDGELEELGLRFLTEISNSPHWTLDLSITNEDHQTIAHLCVLPGFTRLLTKVVNWGIDLDVRDVNGLTALHCAYLREEWGCVQILKEAGANEWIKDNLGRTPREMYRNVESGGTDYSEMEAGRFSSAGEEDWFDVPGMFPSPDNSALLDAQMMPQPDWRNSSDPTVGGTSPLPMPGPSSDDSWIQDFGDLHISEFPPPLARTFSSVTGSPSRREDGPPQYGWSQQICPQLPMGAQWNVSSGAPARSPSLPPASSFEGEGPAPAFPIPDPAVLFPMPEPAPLFPVPELAFQFHRLGPVPQSFLPPPPTMPSFPVSGQSVPSLDHYDLSEPSSPIPRPPIPSFGVPGPAALAFPVIERPIPSFPIHEPTEYLGGYMNSLRLSPSPQQNPPRMATYPVPIHHNPAPTPHFHGSHTTHPNAPPFPPRPPPSQSTQQLHEPPPSPHYCPSPPTSPPPHYSSSEGAFPSLPPHLFRFEKEEMAIRHQFREAMRTTWLRADLEKEMQSVGSRIEQMTVTLGNGNDAFADADEESIQ